MIVYFDTNAFRDLVEPGRGDPDLTRDIIAKVRDGALQITPSFEVLNELVMLWQYEVDNHQDPVKFQAAWELCRDICDWKKHVLKDSGEIFQADIKSFAKTGRQANPYMLPMDPGCSFMQTILKQHDLRDLFDSTDWSSMITKTQTMRGKFVNGVLKPIPTKRLEANQGDFEKLFTHKRTYEIMIRDHAKRLGVFQSCQRKGLLRLYKIPTLRLGMGYLLYRWFKQISTGSDPKPSDTFDFRHAILAGAVGRIVTNDRKLRNAIQAIPGHSVNVSNLEELREELFSSIIEYSHD